MCDRERYWYGERKTSRQQLQVGVNQVPDEWSGLRYPNRYNARLAVDDWSLSKDFKCDTLCVLSISVGY